MSRAINVLGMGRKSRFLLPENRDRLWSELVCRFEVNTNRSHFPPNGRKRRKESPAVSDQGNPSFSMNKDQGPNPFPLGISLRSWSLTGLGRKYANERFPRNHFLISLMSYNVLSDQLCRRHPELYTGKPDYVLDWESRFMKIISEVSYLKSQIVCLQEVDSEHFASHFVPALTKLGYKGIYKKRTNDKMDGCAIFYKENELFLEHWDEVEYNQPFVSSLDRDNVGIVAKFRPLGARPVDAQFFCVATTHLLYNPKRQDVKLAQLAVLLAELDRISFCGYTQRGRDPPEPNFYPCIVTGDFNLMPSSPIYKFMVEGKCSFNGKSRKLCNSASGERLGKVLLPPRLGITDRCKHLELTHNRNIELSSQRPTRLFNSESGNGAYFGNDVHPSFSECFGSGSLFHSFRFRSAYKPSDGEQGATAYQQGYIMVDYIFYSGVRNRFHYERSAEGNLKLLSRLNLLPGSKISEIGGFPGHSLPSDHLCLAANFLLSPKWH